MDEIYTLALGCFASGFVLMGFMYEARDNGFGWREFVLLICTLFNFSTSYSMLSQLTQAN